MNDNMGTLAPPGIHNEPAKLRGSVGIFPMSVITSNAAVQRSVH